jgi:integrase/recombinase XerD
MYTTTCNDEAVIRLVGRMSIEFPELDQLRVRVIAEEVLYKYDVVTKETSLVASDLEDKLQMYLAVKKLDGLSGKTLKNYHYELLRFGSYLRKPLSTVTTTDIRMYLANRCNGLKESTANSIRSYLKTFFGWLQNEKYIIDNPTSKIKPTKQPKRVREPLSEEEIELTRQACKTIREQALLEFAYSTGARLSEIVGVNISDINWHERTLKVIGKGNKERIVYFSAKAKVYIRKYLAERGISNSDALFIATKQPRARLGHRSIENEIKAIAQKSGIDKNVFVHILRHTFATLGLKSGMSINVLQSLLGHESLDVTMIYAQTDQETAQYEYRKHLNQ